MNSIKTYLNGLGRTTRTVVLGLAVVFVSAGIAQAATTISTNIQTDGTLSATGLSTFVNASTTGVVTIAGPLWVGGNATTTAAGALTLNGAFSGTSGTFSTTLGVTGLTTLVNASTTGVVTIAGPLWVGGNATTTAAGAISTQSTLNVLGLTTLANASTTGVVTVAGPLWVGGNATTTAAGALSLQSTLNVLGNTTLASTTATTMKVGQVGTGMTRIVSGYCVTASVAIPATNASSTQTYTNCTPSEGTSIISANDRVFVQATSSLPYYVAIQSASSTASGGLINVGMTNFSTSTSATAVIYAFNFWAFQ